MTYSNETKIQYIKDRWPILNVREGGNAVITSSTLASCDLCQPVSPAGRALNRIWGCERANTSLHKHDRVKHTQIQYSIRIHLFTTDLNSTIAYILWHSELKVR